MIDHQIFPVGSLPTQYDGQDNLINGSFPQVCITVPLSDETDLKRGAVLGQISEGPNKGKYKLAKADAKDGSSNPQCILAEKYQASQKNTQIPAYLTGQFNTKSLSFGEGVNPTDAAIELRKFSIFISPSISRIRS